MLNLLILTKKQAVEEHRKMWNWIADETLKREQKVWKEDYFRKVYPILTRLVPENNCFCCGYVVSEGYEVDIISASVYDFFPECSKHCPLKWAEHDGCCIQSDSVYMKWYDTSNYEKAAEYARIIAELPEKEDTEV